MPLRVHCLMQYLTAHVDEMRSDDYTAQSVVKAVKGKDPGGRRAELTYRGKNYAFGPSDPNGAIRLWIDWAVEQLREIAPSKSAFVLVPVPNKSAIAGSHFDFPTLGLCRRLSEAFGEKAKVAAELKWDQQLKPAREGGPRFADQLFPHLRLEISNERGPRILIDDVLTSGGHLKACAAKLREIDLDPIGAICCGRTFKHQIDKPFRVPVEVLPDYDSGSSFDFSDIFEKSPD